MHGNTLVFVGTYSEPIKQGTGEIVDGKGKGIYVYRFDRESGLLQLLSIAEGERNPSYMTLDQGKKYLYSTNELKEFEGQASGSLTACALNPETGALTVLNRKPTGGTDPCHVIVNDENTHVFVSNFMSGSVCVYPINPDGSLADASEFIQHHGSSVHPDRQLGSHAHALIFDKANKTAFVPDLGMDQILIYKPDFCTGQLHRTEKDFVATKAGAGPRHAVFDRSGNHLYLINELDSTLNVYRYNAAKQTLTEIQSLSTLPDGYKGKSSCSAIKISPDGCFLYGGNRGHNSIAIFKIDAEDGKLSAVDFQSTGGAIPRDFDIDSTGNFLLAGNQDSDNVVVFKIDTCTGRIQEISRTEVPTPICVRIFDVNL